MNTRHKYILLPPILLLLFSVFFASAVSADPNGTIRGQVTNGTDKGNPVTGIEVELLTLLNRQGPPVITKTQTDEEGNFVFEHVESAPEHAHLVRVTFQGQPYFSDLLTFDQDKLLEVPLVVYDVTQDSSKIQYRRTHVIIEFDGEQMFVGQLHFVDNVGDRTFVGDKTSKVLHFDLPPEAKNLRFQDPSLDKLVVQEENGFRLDRALTPGESQVFFSYVLSYHYPNERIVFTLTHGVKDLVVLVSDIGQEVDTPDLTAQGRRPAQGVNYYMFSGNDVPAGKAIQLDLHNLPPPQAQTSSSPTSSSSAPTPGVGSMLPPWAGLVMLALGIIAAAGYATLQRPDTDTIPRSEALRQDWERLVQSIARLDDRFEDGKIGQATYRKERSAIKIHLIKILHPSQEQKPE